MSRFTLMSVLLIAAVLGGASSSLCDEVGRIRVEGPIGATVVLDGEEVGAISDSLGILMLDGVGAGGHAVVAMSEGCVSQVVTVWLAPGSERVVRFRRFSSTESDPPGSTPAAPAGWGSVAVQPHSFECTVEILELGLSGTSSPGAPWLADGLSPGRYSARLFMKDFTTDLVFDVCSDTLTQILVGFGDNLAEQRFHAFSALDTSGLPFDRDGRVRQGSRVFGVFDEPPLVIEHVPPVYPDMARMAELEGKVVVQIGIDERGNVVEATVLQGIDGLNQAAIEAVYKWKFRPAKQRGVHVPVRIVVPILFHLRGLD